MPKPTKTKQPAARGPQGKVLQDGVLMLFGVVGDDWFGFTAAQVVEDLHALAEEDKNPIRVLLNSPGGDVAEGLAIYQQLKESGSEVEIEVLGLAASAASMIAMAGDTVSIAPNAHMMIHDPWFAQMGNAEQLRRAADILDRFGASLADIYAEKTGLDPDDIREMMAVSDGEGTWFTAEEAVEQGFADELTQAPEDEEEEAAAAFARLDLTELQNVPDRLVATVRQARARVRQDNPAPSQPSNEEGRTMAKPSDRQDPQAPAPTPEPQAEAEPQNQPTPEEQPTPAPQAKAPTAQPPAQPDPAAVAREAVRAERERIGAIRAFAARFPSLPSGFADQHIGTDATADAFRVAVANHLAAQQEAEGGPSNIPGGVGVGADEEDKWMTGAEAWLLTKAGKAAVIERHTGTRPDPGEFRGLRLMDLAKDHLERRGVSTRGKDPMSLARVVLTRSPRAAADQNTRDDFPVLLENALNKLLQAEYALQPTRWRDVAAEGSVSDFREHKRLRKGSIGRLQDKLESGEFRHVNIPDGERGVVQASTQGVHVGISRQAIVNDDVGAFMNLMSDLGQASARSIDIDLFDLLKSNAGLGPSIGPFRFEGTVEGAAKTLFHADRENIDGTAAATSVDSLERMRVLMAQQMDPNGEDFLDLRPAVWVGPIGLGSAARTVVQAEFDFEANTEIADTAVAHQYRKPNRVRDLVSTFVDTPRLTGTRYYLLASPNVAPVFEVVFLDGMASPVMEVENPLVYDGVQWLVRFDFGVAASDFRGAVTNAGA